MKIWPKLVIGLTLTTALAAGVAPPIVTPRGPEMFIRSGDTGSGNRVASDEEGTFLALFYNVFSGSIDARGGTSDAFFPPFSIGGGSRVPAVAALGGGEFVISWSQDENYPGDGEDIQARRFQADGTPTGPLVIVSENTGFLGTHTAVGARPDSFIVAWEADSDPGIEVLAQIVPFVGAPPTPLPLSTFTTGSPAGPRLAVAPDGRTLVAWRQTDCTPSDPEGGCIVAQGVDAAGALLGANFQVNSETTGSQSFPAVAASEDSFVVVWTSTDCGSECIRGRLFDADGDPLGDDFRVDEPGADSADRAGVAMTDSGDFVVSWVRRVATDSLTYARVFDASARPRTGEFLVNSDPRSEPYETEVAINNPGNFVVVWSDNYNLWGRFFDLNLALFEDGFESGDISSWDTATGTSAPQ